MPKAEIVKRHPLQRFRGVQPKPVVLGEAERLKQKAEAETKRDEYILESTKTMKSIQKQAEKIVKKCQEILSKCDTGRGDIAHFKTLVLHDEDGEMELENTVQSLWYDVHEAEEADKKAIELSM
jgi:hypothetical protein